MRKEENSFQKRPTLPHFFFLVSCGKWKYCFTKLGLGQTASIKRFVWLWNSWRRSMNCSFCVERQHAAVYNFKPLFTQHITWLSNQRSFFSSLKFDSIFTMTKPNDYKHREASSVAHLHTTHTHNDIIINWYFALKWSLFAAIFACSRVYKTNWKTKQPPVNRVWCKSQLKIHQI